MGWGVCVTIPPLLQPPLHPPSHKKKPALNFSKPFRTSFLMMWRLEQGKSSHVATTSKMFVLPQEQNSFTPKENTERKVEEHMAIRGKRMITYLFKIASQFRTVFLHAGIC